MLYTNKKYESKIFWCKVEKNSCGNRAEAEGRQGWENLVVRTAPQFLLWSLIVVFLFLLKIYSLSFLGDFKMI